jgi:hypothetical protein
LAKRERDEDWRRENVERGLGDKETGRRRIGQAMTRKVVSGYCENLAIEFAI